MNKYQVVVKTEIAKHGFIVQADSSLEAGKLCMCLVNGERKCVDVYLKSN